MPYLKLVEPATERVVEIREPAALLGRDPSAALSFGGETSKVVSARHAELHFTGHAWLVSDLDSRNGTFVNGRRIDAPTTLKAGDSIRLGERGPTLSVMATGEALEETIAEHAAFEPRAYSVTLLAAASGQRHEARGARIRIGRGKECEVRAVDGGDRSVSRVHAELVVAPSGGLTVRDAGSRNGTYLNGERVSGPVPVRIGDKIRLGETGPVLIVEGLGTLPGIPAVKAARPPAARRTFAQLVGIKSRIRWLSVAVVVLVVLLAGAVYGVYWLLSNEVQLGEQARRTAEDSARAEVERLRRELSDARAAAAPAAQVELLRVQLESAQQVTSELRAALGRAQAALSQQLAAGEARREEAQRDLERLRGDLTAAERRAPSQALIDSLRRAVTSAETQAANLDAKLRAVRGADFASVAQQTQGAVGLVTVRIGREYFDGTGFVSPPMDTCSPIGTSWPTASTARPTPCGSPWRIRVWRVWPI